MQKITSDQAIANGIRRTINRFRENPFYYFTESDIHASLVKDILDGNSDKFYLPGPSANLRLSMVHLEYPTNFSFSRAKAYGLESSDYQLINEQRGNFDLVVLKEKLFREIAENNSSNSLILFIKSIVSKNIDLNQNLHSGLGLPVGELIDYAIEVKFAHFNNASQVMFDQVKIDNYKLEQAISGGANLKPINLIFCYYWNDENDSNKNWRQKLEAFRQNLKEGYIGKDDISKKEIPPKVLNIFIEAFVDQKADKETAKPSCYYSDVSGIIPPWVLDITKGYD